MTPRYIITYIDTTTGCVLLVRHSDLPEQAHHRSDIPVRIECREVPPPAAIDQALAA